MYSIEINNALEKIGSSIAGKIVDAAAVASAVIILRSGVKDPKIIAGAFVIYATAKRKGQLVGEIAGRNFSSFPTSTLGMHIKTK